MYAVILIIIAMAKEVLFSIPVFRGTKNKKTFIYTNFQKALQGMLDNDLFFVEYFADINFYPLGQNKVLRSEIRRIYLADIRPYKELWYRAVNDKWLKVPKDFMYDRKYKDQEFLFSKRAREIGEIYQGEFLALTEDSIKRLTQDGDHQNQTGPGINLIIQKDFEFSAGDGIFFSSANKERDMSCSLQKLRKKAPDYICLYVNEIAYKENTSKEKIKNFLICAEEDKISADEALKRSKNSIRIQKAIELGITNFIYNEKQKFVACADDAIFVPRNTILNAWKI